jgi:hypothetical protein
MVLGNGQVYSHPPTPHTHTHTHTYTHTYRHTYTHTHTQRDELFKRLREKEILVQRARLVITERHQRKDDKLALEKQVDEIVDSFGAKARKRKSLQIQKEVFAARKLKRDKHAQWQLTQEAEKRASCAAKVDKVNVIDFLSSHHPDP